MAGDGELERPAAGRARVAKDSLDTSQLDMKEAEQKALADQALADFAAKEGIAFEGATPAGGGGSTESAVKAMGPVAPSSGMNWSGMLEMVGRWFWPESSAHLPADPAL